MHARRSTRGLVAPWLWLALLAPSASAQTPTPDVPWTADALLESSSAITDPGLGAVQGVAVRDGKVYAYGDVFSEDPRVGVIREYGPDLKPTGRVVWLRKGGTPLLVHPTGLTWDETLGTFLGDTVKIPGRPDRSRAVIYRLDWAKAWEDGNLDRAVLDVIDDDAAINGCRPTLVKLEGKTLLATADYGDVHPEVRLYDPNALLKARRSSAPGVTVARFLCGPFNQNLHWDAENGHLVCVQNVIEGRGWRLDEIDLAKAVANGRADGPGARSRTLTFPSHDELEGYWPLGNGRVLMAVARREANVVSGVIRQVEPRPSPAGGR